MTYALEVVLETAVLNAISSETSLPDKLEGKRKLSDEKETDNEERLLPTRPDPEKGRHNNPTVDSTDWQTSRFEEGPTETCESPIETHEGTDAIPKE